MSWFVFDVIAELSLRESFSCLKDDKFQPWVKPLTISLERWYTQLQQDSNPLVEKLMLKFLPKHVMNMQRQHSTVVNKKLDRRLNLEKDKPGFVAPFMKDNADFHKVSLKDTQFKFALLVVAGADATTTMLSATFLYLAQNRDTLRSLILEIRNTFLKEEDILAVSTKELPLSQCGAYGRHSAHKSSSRRLAMYCVIGWGYLCWSLPPSQIKFHRLPQQLDVKERPRPRIQPDLTSYLDLQPISQSQIPLL